MSRTALRMMAITGVFLLPACGSSSAGGIVVIAPSNLFFSGSQSGPDLAAQQIRLEAAPALFFGQAAWSATPDQPWITVSPSSGTLQPGQKVTLTVKVQATEGWKGATSTVNAPFVDAATIA